MGWFGQLHLEVDGIGHILASVIRFYSQKTNEHTKSTRLPVRGSYDKQPFGVSIFFPGVKNRTRATYGHTP